ncbi:MAG: MoxR family ATPase [Flavobacteriales bacterium]|nr:MoxR family ATPase [Flavobacteriales bacterium]
MTNLEKINKIKESISKSIIGQDHLVNRLVMVLLSDGNMLLEGLPGLAKTRAVKSLANVIEAGLSRIQFTPDLLPSDVTGTEIYMPDSEEKFQFQQGPIFDNLILADEINRAPAKVQAALLEAMEERQVTVSGKTHKLPKLFMVLATQNPVEQEGTYPLPEAQMDRFLMHVIISYPSNDAELEVLRLVREESKNKSNPKKEEIDKFPQELIFEARKEIEQITVSEAVEKYIIALIDATRFPEKYDEDLAKWIEFGASPRGSISLDKASRANAWMNGRDFVTPDDVQAILHDVLRHRLILSYQANAKGITADKALDEIIKLVAVG